MSENDKVYCAKFANHLAEIFDNGILQNIPSYLVSAQYITSEEYSKLYN